MAESGARRSRGRPDSPQAEVIMRTFTATTEGPNRLGLCELLDQYANEQWVAVHMSDELPPLRCSTASSVRVVKNLSC